MSPSLNDVPLGDLPSAFRERAAWLREYAAEEQAATVCEQAAIEVESRRPRQMLRYEQWLGRGGAEA